MMRVASAGTIGALLERYDYYISATASAPVFGRLFFPGGDPVTGTMAALGVFADTRLSPPKKRYPQEGAPGQ
jgi:hypothetical protein